MAYLRWSWLMEGDGSEQPDEAADMMISTTAADLFGEGGYPALFNLSEGLGFFAVGPGEGLLYYFDKRRETAFLFPRTVK